MNDRTNPWWKPAMRALFAVDQAKAAEEEAKAAEEEAKAAYEEAKTRCEEADDKVLQTMAFIQKTWPGKTFRELIAELPESERAEFARLPHIAETWRLRDRPSAPNRP